MCQNASRRFPMHLDASEWIRTGPNRSEQARKPRKNRENLEKFAKFSRTFSRFSSVFRGFWACSDLFGPVRIHSDAFGCIWMPSDAFGHFRKISKIFDEKIGFASASAIGRFLKVPRRLSTPHVPLMWGGGDAHLLSNIKW